MEVKYLQNFLNLLSNEFFKVWCLERHKKWISVDNVCNFENDSLLCIFTALKKRTSICRCGANLFHHFQLVFEPIMVKWFFYQRPLSPLSIFLVSCFENRTGMFQLKPMQPIFSTIAAALVRVNQFGPRISVFSLLKQNLRFPKSSSVISRNQVVLIVPLFHCMFVSKQVFWGLL